MERFERSSQPAYDEERTQVIRPSRSFDGRQGGGFGALEAGVRPEEERPVPEATSPEPPRSARRPRTPADRAAARARRRRQIRRRRLVALAVIVLVVVLLVVLLVRGCGGSTGAQASAGPLPPTVALAGPLPPPAALLGGTAEAGWAPPEEYAGLPRAALGSATIGPATADGRAFESPGASASRWREA